MIDNDAAWLVTGCSRGLGRALAEQVLDSGYRLVATACRLGGDAIDLMRNKIADLERDLDRWEELTRSTNLAADDGAPDLAPPSGFRPGR